MNHSGIRLFLILFVTTLSVSFSFSNLPCYPSAKRSLERRNNQSTLFASDNKPDKVNESPISVESQTAESHVIPVVLVLASALSFFAIPTGAIDNPVDFIHLDIPIPIPDYRYFLAGGLCAAASHGVTTPIDVVKTRIQADPLSYNKGFLDAVTRISEEGGGALLRGLGPTVIGYGVEGAAKFGLYESLKPEVAKILSLDSPAIPYLIASIVAGATASIMLCPMEKARVRLVTDPDFASNLITGIPKLIDESGISGLFGGLPAMLSKQVPYTFAKQVSFDTFATMLYAVAANANFAAADVKFEVSFGAALLASVLACLLSQPGDVILTATYKGSNASFGSVVSQITENRGIQGFFSGLSARFIHVGAIITSQLVLYDVVKQLLGLPATGS
uniref:Mitochondrial phosphate carrier protein n=1 Tax=Ditylum brightwellii TaxID=49249 RepID=A0A6U3SQ47_9STRA|mmetsp:Transcript_3484/g.5378  ORF Transcript_3484/g.5378 Transcript_3484/m.5378 type:complete len:390 (+) Transcript_3484:34-1203(+)